MPKRIFKAGNYGHKGDYSVDTLKSWIGKEFSITAGHVGDWTSKGYPTTAIPVAGSCKAVGVDEEGYLLAEFTYNSFGDSIKKMYPNVSIGIGKDGNPNHIALLGYAPPHLTDLDKSFSEFSQDLTSIEETQIIEFAEDEQAKVDEFVAFIRGVDASKVKLSNLFDALWEKSSEKDAVDKLKNAGYTVEKTAEFSKEILGNIANTLGYILAEKPVENLTQAEMYEKVRAEFTRDNEKKEVKEKLVKMFPPVMHKIIEFAIDKAFDEKEYSNMIEFSEEEKGTMANKLKEFAKGNGPFEHLFKNISSGIEFSDNTEEETNAKDRIAAYYKK